ncbi:hypothetical protein Trydic_g16355 [Trypoxylus dichotomus]
MTTIWSKRFAITFYFKLLQNFTNLWTAFRQVTRSLSGLRHSQKTGPEINFPTESRDLVHSRLTVRMIGEELARATVPKISSSKLRVKKLVPNS